MKKISNKSRQGALTITIFFGDFCRHIIKTCKAWPNFSKFPSASTLAIRYDVIYYIYHDKILGYQ